MGMGMARVALVSLRMRSEGSRGGADFWADVGMELRSSFRRRLLASGYLACGVWALMLAASEDSSSQVGRSMTLSQVFIFF